MAARHLRVITANGKLLGPPPVQKVVEVVAAAVLTIEEALAIGRVAVSILTAEPADEHGGYSSDEITQQVNATDRLIEAFKALDVHLKDGHDLFTL